MSIYKELNNVEIITSSLFTTDRYGKKYYARIDLKDAITEFDKAVDDAIAEYCKYNTVKIRKSDLLNNHKDGIVSVSSCSKPMVFEGDDNAKTAIVTSTENYSGRTADVFCEIGIYEYEGAFGLSKELEAITIHDTNDPVKKKLMDMRKQYESACNPNACKNNLSDILND